MHPSAKVHSSLQKDDAKSRVKEFCSLPLVAVRHEMCKAARKAVFQDS